MRGKDDALVQVAPLLKLAPPWRGFLARVIREEDIKLLRAHEQTGRRLGDEEFLATLEENLGRILRRQKPGPKPRPARNPKRPTRRTPAPATELGMVSTELREASTVLLTVLCICVAQTNTPNYLHFQTYHEVAGERSGWCVTTIACSPSGKRLATYSSPVVMSMRSLPQTVSNYISDLSIYEASAMSENAAALGGVVRPITCVNDATKFGNVIEFLTEDTCCSIITTGHPRKLIELRRR